MNLFQMGHTDFVQIVQCKIDIRLAMKRFSNQAQLHRMQFNRTETERKKKN